MEETYRQFFRAMDQFHKLNIGALFSDLTKFDCVTVLSIGHFSQKKGDTPLTVSEVAERMHAKSSAVSRTLKNLEDKGFIVRTVNKSDRRNTYVELTEAGKAECSRMEQRMEEFAKKVFSRMNEADLCKLIAYLNQLFQAASEELEIQKSKMNEK